MIKSITSVKVTGRRVVVRAGFDVPLSEVGDRKSEVGKWIVADDTRIKDVLPTLKYLIEQKAKIIIISHLGRPDAWDNDKSLEPVAIRLQKLLGVGKIDFLPEDITKHDYVPLTKTMHDGDILFLENLRFYKGEQDNSEEFINLLASFGEVYVNEAFSVAHRKEASIFGLAKKLQPYGGISFMQEIQALQKIILNPALPMVVLMGGIKIEGKVETIHNLAKHATKIIVGGGIGSTFLKALGYDVGQSKISEVNVAKQLLRQYKDKLVMPVDVVVATDLKANPRVSAVDKILPNEAIFDTGPESIRKFATIIKTAKTLVWNGPFGKFEDSRYSFGSKAIAQVFAMQSKGKAYGLVGGGETAEVLDQAKVSEFVDYISTGGGAMLEFLSGKQLPGIEALER